MAQVRKQLSKAPLAEVVFDLRWDTGVRPGVVLTTIDPGFPVLQRNFGEWAARAGLPEVELMTKEGQIALPHTVVARFRRSKEELFPIWQIGPGIYAANDSSKYQWSVFKKHCMKGLDGVFRTYPEMKSSPLKPISLELRYWDLFDGEVLADRDLVSFVNDTFDMHVEVPEFCKNQALFDAMRSGVLRFTFPVKRHKNTMFSVEFTTGRREGNRVVRMESKVRTEPVQFSSLRKSAVVARIALWLESAHDVTSPFFRSVVRPEAMEKFE